MSKILQGGTQVSDDPPPDILRKINFGIGKLYRLCRILDQMAFANPEAKRRLVGEYNNAIRDLGSFYNPGFIEDLDVFGAVHHRKDY